MTWFLIVFIFVNLELFDRLIEDIYKPFTEKIFKWLKSGSRKKVDTHVEIPDNSQNISNLDSELSNVLDITDTTADHIRPEMPKGD